MGNSNREKFLLLKAKTLGFLRERGVYLTLFACLAVVGVAAAVAFTPETGDAGETPPPVEDVNRSGDESISALFTPKPTATARVTPTPAPTPSATPIPDFTKAPVPEKPKAAPELLTAPVEGSIIWDFAINELIYSETLDQWTTHAGVDVAAKKGGEVRCVLAGIVERVYEDDALGVCVLVSHSGGYLTLYGNLADKPPVTEGQKVDARAVVGHIGNTAVSECGQKSHLHFELMQDGKPVDPKERIMFTKTG